jgi:uncharacterized membrane protein
MPDTNKSGLSDNALGAIAYITVVPAIFFLAIPPYNKRAFVRFHAWQSTLLFAVTFILYFVLSFFPTLNTYLKSLVCLGLYLLILIVWVLISLWCMIGALKGKRVKIPALGAWAELQSSK